MAGAVLLSASSLEGQTIRGEVRQAEGNTPIVGAFVTAVDSDGAGAGAVLTDRSGRFRLRLEVPGRYRLQIERIGFESITTPPIDLTDDENVELSFPLSRRAIALEGITAEAEQRCVLRPEEGLAVHELWEEARKALEVSSFVESGRLYRFRTELYVRELDSSARRVVRQLDSRVHSGYGSPFSSLPSEDLQNHGFAVEDDEGWILYAPDADALLSEEFLDTHCFRVVEQEGDAALIGLGFEPIPRRSLPEVQGVLWLDRASSALQFLEYGYVNLPLPRQHLGGRVEFDILDSGAWIVQRWWIRSPIAVRVERRDGFRTVGSSRRIEGVREEGGEVIEVRSASGSRQEEASVVAGTVHDSIRGGGLSGARVFLNGTQYAATTDEEGRFELTGARAGTYSISFRHPLLDSLAAVAPLVDVEIMREGRAEVALAVPPLESILAGECLREGSAKGRAVGGVVRNAATGVPLAGAAVTIEWRGDGGAERLQVESDSRGRYRVCGVPEGSDVSLEASFLGLPGERETVDSGGEAPGVLRDLSVHLTRVRAGEQGISGVVDGGTIRVNGRLLDQAGASVEGARIRLLGTRIGTDTGADGTFTLRSVPPGSYQLEIEHPAFGTVTEDIALGGGRSAELEIRVPFRLEPAGS